MIQFEVVLKPEQETFKECDEKLRAWISSHASEYVIARHDKFSSEQYSNDLHFHYFVKLSASWSLDNLSRSVGIPSHCFEKIKKKWKTAILYARHINNTEGKPLIDKQFIETNINNYDDLCASALASGYPSSRARVLPNEVIEYANGTISYRQLRERISFEVFNEFRRDIQNATAYRVKRGINRDMQVVYITGASGSGKTTFAKFLGESLGYEVFISASGKDPLDNYDSEECIILDDLRADSFTKAELFKLLDNHTESAVKSRYYNKFINNCRLLLITSIKEPHLLYDWSGEQAEPFAQFARRLNWSFLWIKDDKFYECVYDKKHPLQTVPTPKLRTEFDMDTVRGYYKFKKGVSHDINSLMQLAAQKSREELERGK